jgi:2'-5' RNA ligase
MRLFLAIELPVEVKTALSSIRRPPLADLRWIAPEQLHITLKFLGEVPDADVPQLLETLAAVPTPSPLSLRVSGLAMFPERGRVRIVAADVADDAGGIVKLAESLEAACESLGFTREGRPYRAHVTLARAKMPVRRELVKVDVPAMSFTEKQFVLMQSKLSSKGPTYTVAARFPLK